MSSSSKENQVLTAIPEPATSYPVASSTAAPSGDTARSQPAALEVSVTVNGARTVAGSDKREPFSESTKTVLIFGHGAVVRLASSVAPGQLLFLTNDKTKKEVVCQVVKSKNYQNTSGYVELEFTQPVAGFWGMRFAAERSSAQSSPSHSSQAPSTTSAATVATVASVPTAASLASSIVNLPETQGAIGGSTLESKPSTLPSATAETQSRSEVNSEAAPSALPFESAPAQSLADSAISSNQPAPVSQNDSDATLESGSTLDGDELSLEEQLANLFPTEGTASKKSQAEPVSQTDEAASDSEIAKIETATLPASLPLTLTSISQASLTTARTSAEPFKSILDNDEIKIPAWLEPLARNAAAASIALPEPGAKDLERLPKHKNSSEAEDLAITEISAVPEAAKHGERLPSFGTYMLADENDLPTPAAPSGSNKKFLFGAIAAGVLLLVSLGGWYLHQSAGTAQTQVAPVASGVANGGNSSSPAPSQRHDATTNQSSPSGTHTTAPARVPVAGNSTSGGASGTSSGTFSGTSSGASLRNGAANTPEITNARLTSTTKAPAVGAGSNAVAAQPKKSTAGSARLAAPKLNAGKSEYHAEEALDLGASSQPAPGEGLASGLLVSSSKQPTAPSASSLPIGGDVRQAKLISTASPVYPAMAKAQRVSGNVLIDALVDASGNVTTMKVVSGPGLLQQAAMDALHKWKYQPAQLHGKPVPMHLTVTVQFHLQ